ncbi:MAG: hypothetical protein GXY61_03965 [Lentisphaerae bacterium]|nr:hypothetical protein [Lentisphaerota bacterium]
MKTCVSVSAAIAIDRAMLSTHPAASQHDSVLGAESIFWPTAGMPILTLRYA